MPELPEVATYKTYLDSTSLHQKIIDFDCADDRLLKKDASAFSETLINGSFKQTHRIGKYLFIETSSDQVVVMHFGMTGHLQYYKDEEDRPKYGHIVFTFENGFHLAFINKRKFGFLDLADSISQYQKKTGLSNDAARLTLEEFKESLLKRKTHIKPVLMDQSVAAGMGNWLTDEVLYQSRIHPEKKVEHMSEKDIEHLFQTMQEVIRVTLDNEADYSRFPDDFFIHIRKEGATCHHTGQKIKKKKVGGRTTYFCEAWQGK